MNIPSYAKRLFSLDTLDTRFTRSSSAPFNANGSAPLDPAKPPTGLESRDTGPKGKRGDSTRRQDAQPSNWSTPEFFFYYLVLVVAIPLMFKSVYDVSIPSHPNYPKYEHLLSPGWILGRKVDNSDQQYSGFRDNIPYMALLLAFHPLLRRFYELLRPINTNIAPELQKAGPGAQDRRADARLDQRVRFDIGFACFYLLALHGTSALKIFAILYINFALAKGLPRSYKPWATWIFNIGILFANELCKGYPYTDIARLVLPATSSDDPAKNWGSYLDSYGGLLPRWEILFKITVLRLISFNLDYCWSLDRAGGSPLEVNSVSAPFQISFMLADGPKKKQLEPSDLSERDRVDIPAKSEDYSFRNYVAYILYSPLYLAGPILTFNDYIAQLRYRPQSITPDRTTLYGIRFIISLLTMEVMLHFIYAVAISKSQPAWEIYTPFQLSMLGYFNLHIIWLKLLLPWRFFRLWALLDGMDPAENMVRCMSDNYSALAFWRGWHRSFNRWIVRYIYIPLGGSGGPGTHGQWGKARAVINMLVVFTFVALWHDIQLKLLIWGWLITLFVLPEVLAGYAFPKQKWQNHKHAYRMICGIGAVGNVLMMMAANLVGFAVGLDGLMGLVHGIVGSYSGLVFLVTAYGALFVGVQVMFELREHELRHAPLPSNPIWISDDLLNHALHRFTLLRVPRRHGSTIPGPLEARKRTAKRRMMGLVPTATGGLHPHPGFLSGLKKERESQQGWQWKGAEVAQPRDSQLAQDDAPALGPDIGGAREGLPLPSWLMDHDPMEDESMLPRAIARPMKAESPSKAESVAAGNPRSPEARLRHTNNLGDMREIIGSVNEQDPLRRIYSRIALENFLKSDLDMDKILDFLADPILSPWSTGNHCHLMSHFIRNPNYQMTERLCQWMVHQFSLGLCPQRDIMASLTSLSNLSHQNEWRGVLEKYYKGIVDTLRSSSVVHAKDLEPWRCCRLLRIAFHDLYSEPMLTAGLELMECMDQTQLRKPSEKLSQSVERLLRSWDPSRVRELNCEKLGSKLSILLLKLPQKIFFETIRLVSLRIIGHSPSEDDFTWQRHSIWWSALRSPDVFQRINQTKCLRDIESALRRRRENVVDSEALIKINEKLGRHDVSGGRWSFLDRPDIPLERCPVLAEALILDPNRHWDTAINLRELRQTKVIAELRKMGQCPEAEQLQFDRVRLLERMALAYAQAPHLQPSIAFYYVNRCWTLHKQDGLGPVRPAMVRALTHSGLVRPLQAGQAMSHARLKFILEQVEEAEGQDVMRRVGQVVWRWREDNHRRKQRISEEEKENDQMEWDAAIRELVEEDPQRWERIANMAAAAQETGPKRKKTSPGVTSNNVFSSSGNLAPVDRMSDFREPLTSPEREQDFTHIKSQEPSSPPSFSEPAASDVRLPKGANCTGDPLPSERSPLPLEAADIPDLPSTKTISSDQDTNPIAHPSTPLHPDL
ncbi:MAG: hypothetical protein Q9212_004508, partial [Teloschistes hypoglaucus]